MILNFASNRKPGGGYKNGRTAQEEDLFRRTTLSLVLDSDVRPKPHYPINPIKYRAGTNMKGLYTGGIRALRDSKKNQFKFYDNEYQVDVCTIPAFDGREKAKDDYPYYGDAKSYTKPRILNDTGLELTRQKIEIMFQMALKHNVKVLIAGAFGCGVFENIPELIIDLFNETMYKYRTADLEVVFAVIGPNVGVFRKHIATDFENKPCKIYQ